MTTAKPRSVQPEDLLLIKTITDVQLSPDGSRIAYALTEVDAPRDEYRTNIWVVAAEGEPTQFTGGPGQDTAPRWSPDGRRLAFLSDRDGRPPQLYLARVDDGEARKLTSLQGGAGPPVWSPDGTRILFAARAPKEIQPADETVRARWNQRPKVVTKAHYKSDGHGFTFDTCSHLFVVSVEGHSTKQITNSDDDLSPAWSPNGKQIVFSRTRGGLTDCNLSDIWVVDAEGENPRRLTESIGRAISPSWSPDGARIACLGTDEQEHGLGETLVRIWTIPATGGLARRLTAKYDRGVALLQPPTVTLGPVWSLDSRTLTFTAADAGCIHIVRADALDAVVHPIVIGERQITSASAVATAQRIAFCATERDNPCDVYICEWDGSDERQVTRANATLVAQLNMPRVERRTFTNPNGGNIDGWLMRPAGNSAPAPLLIRIHGGPHGFVGNAFSASHFYQYVLASRGWAVLTLNPSGSGSYGKEFAHSIRGRWGELDCPEHLAAVDALVSEGITDANRLAVAGYSYGGYMVAWMISHTTRFKAAVAGAPIVNLESFYGTADIGMWFSSWYMRGDITTDLETYRRLSPINYMSQVTTPTLILHGEADDRCPVSQAEELYIRLRALGKVPVEFVRYPDASHLFLSSGRPSHRVDYNRRTVEWVERHTLPRTYTEDRQDNLSQESQPHCW